jgi:transposase
MAGQTPPHLVTEFETVYILGLHDGGMSPLAIACKLDRDKSTITRIIQHFSWDTWTGHPQRAPISKITTERDERSLVRTALTNRTTILRDITNHTALTISPRTVQRRLSDHGIKKYIAVTKPFLTPEQMRARLDWAIHRMEWTEADWQKVIWSDESSVEIGRDTKPRWVFRREDERFKPECLKPSFKSKRVSIMVWGCFAGGKLGPLIAYPKGGISSAEYIATLKEGLLPFIIALNNGEDNIEVDQIQVAMGDYIFMQDNAPIHTSAATRAFLTSHHITTMSWPAQSPDLNPIEHLWHALKVKFHERFFQARTLPPSRAAEALTRYIAGLVWAWNTQLGDLPQKLVASMPGRVQAVISARGGHTHY